MNNSRVNNVTMMSPRKTKGKRSDWVLLCLRLLAVLATASATIVMALNKQTKSFVIATIGNNPVKISITAKFHHTPAFVFFVIANGNACLHNLVMIAVDLFGSQFDYKGLRLALIAILDMMVMALAAAGDGAATFMSELGKNGNSHARWDKICDKFEAYCHRGGGALAASFAGILLLLIITGMSIIKLLKPNRINDIVP
ncbi:CASP-like protein 1B1 isoform X1 [Neltuma alba]|uniref:CASP-like protein 1B1 isoform X1 n=2 Tax=Neltuma alba TaxID=207710 RepID=UPI0010A49C33|nr:CASP-like protein 1B1 isoform X1 [Prosopis alba]